MLISPVLQTTGNHDYNKARACDFRLFVVVHGKGLKLLLRAFFASGITVNRFGIKIKITIWRK
jgi:hypothetical protein